MTPERKIHLEGHVRFGSRFFIILVILTAIVYYAGMILDRPFLSGLSVVVGFLALAVIIKTGIYEIFIEIETRSEEK